MLDTEPSSCLQSPVVVHQHTAQFYVEESELYETLAAYVNAALGRGQGVLVVSAGDHWQALTNHLSAMKVRVEEVVACDQLVFIDVDAARAQIMVKGQPSSAHFSKLVESNVEQLRERWSGGVRVYSELGDRLIADGQFGPMRQLGELWKPLLDGNEVELCCGYRLEHFSRQEHEEPFENLCRACDAVRSAGHGGLEAARWQRHALMLRRRTEQQQQRIDQLDAEVERQQALHREKDDFYSKLTHELRNPLAPMVSALEMMNLRADSSSERERGILERQIGRMVDLLEEFGAASRVLFGSEALVGQRVEVAEVLRQAIRRATPRLEERDHRLHVDIPSSGLAVSADTERLSLAVSHLLNNAAEFTAEGGNIWLSAAHEAGSVVISVRDDGAGMPAPMLATVFDPFVCGHRPDLPTRPGMGLGLALVDKIVALHDGAVAAYSDGAGQGSELVIRLPLAQPDKARSPISRLHHEDMRPAGRVLVVDDNEDFAGMLADTLDLLGHEVRRAHDAAAALEMVGEFWPDIALLDINLPGMSGHELAQRLKTRCSSQRDVRLVAVTGYGDERRRQRSEQMGFDAHLVKPVVLSQLQQTIDSVLERS